MRWRFKSPGSRLFAQPFVQAQMKGSIKASRHWPFWWESTDDRWIPRTTASKVEMFPFYDVIIISIPFFKCYQMVVTLHSLMWTGLKIAVILMMKIANIILICDWSLTRCPLEILLQRLDAGRCKTFSQRQHSFQTKAAIPLVKRLATATCRLQCIPYEMH